jgi:hypothetical protein
MTAAASRVAAGNTGRRAGAGLLWTDYWYLTATIIAAVVAVDPLEWLLAADPLLKHLALAISLPAVMLTIAGSRLRVSGPRVSRAVGRPATILWPLLLLAALVMAGGVYARFVQGIQNSFLNFGMYMAVAYCAAAMVWRSEDPEALVRGHVRILLAAAAVMAAYLIANYGGREVYHEQIFLVIPMAILFFSLREGMLLRWAGCLFFLAMAWLSAKYTSYLIGAMTVAYMAFAIAVPRLAPLPGLRRTMLVYWFWLMGGLAVIVFAFLGVNGMLELPTGNVAYRFHTYENAWQRFLDSPLWGTHFAVEAVEKFTLYSIGISDNMLATHSDLLDLLANGGLIAAALWTYALVRIARIVRENLLRPQLLDRSWTPYAHTLAVMSAAGVITYAFNPILLQPALAYLLWTNLGLLVGLALRASVSR